MRNRICFALGKIEASPASTPGALPSTPIKASIESGDAELDRKEWIVTHAAGKVLCARLADIAWVRAVDAGVELRIGSHSYMIHESFCSWAARLPAGRFALRGERLLVNRERLKQLGAALARVFQQRSTLSPAGPGVTDLRSLPRRFS